jgi:hypothetical protein
MGDQYYISLRQELIAATMEEAVRHGRCEYMRILLREEGHSPNQALSVNFPYVYAGVPGMHWDSQNFVRMTCLEYAIYLCDTQMAILLFIHGADSTSNCLEVHTLTVCKFSCTIAPTWSLRDTPCLRPASSLDFQAFTQW